MTIPKFLKKWNIWQSTVHLLAPLPALILLFQYQTNRMGFNPIQTLTLRSGKIALVMLAFTLAVSPLLAWLKQPGMVKARRPLGLYTFFYASLHMLTFFGLDYGFNWPLLWKEILTEKPYVQIGVLAFLTLLPLAITSFRWWMRRLGARWKRLHKLVYLTTVLVIVHYGWVVKGDVLTFQGNITGPLRYGGALIFLLAVRLWKKRGKIFRPVQRASNAQSKTA